MTLLRALAVALAAAVLAAACGIGDLTEEPSLPAETEAVPLDPGPAVESVPDSEPESNSKPEPEGREVDEAPGTAAPSEPPPAQAPEPQPEDADAGLEPAPEAAEPEANPDSQRTTEPGPEAGDGEPAVGDGGSETGMDSLYYLTVDGVVYLLPGSPGGPDYWQTDAWTYDFAAGKFESIGRLPKAFDPSTRQASEDFEFAWIRYPASIRSNFSDFEEKSIRAAAAASGIRIGLVCESEIDPQEIPPCVGEIVRTSPDGVIFSTWLWRWTTSKTAMEIFDNAGIPVVFPRVWDPNAILFSPNAYTAGATAGIISGLYAQKTWGCEGVHILLADATGVGRAVTDLGFIDGVEAVCGDLPVSDFNASIPSATRGEARYWLAANPGAEHVLAYSDNLRAVAVSQAMQDAGRSGVASGEGSAPGFIERLLEGSPEETRFLGSVAEFPELYGVYAVAALIDILEGRAVPSQINVHQAWIDHDNLEQYYDPDGRPVHNLGPALAGGPPAANGDPTGVSAGPVAPASGFLELYTLPGPTGGIKGALRPEEVFPWTYNFDTATFEVDSDPAGGSPAAPFDPSVRTASQDYEIAWVSGWAELEFSQSIEESIRSTAAASGVHVGAICDSEFDPAKALACAETVAASDPDAVIFGNWRREAAVSSMEVFDDSGIPVITIDVWHPNAIFFGADNYASGALAGVNTGRYASETWNCEGVHVLLAQNLTAGEVPDLRTSGFADGAQAVCGGDVPVSRINVDGSPVGAFEATRNWLEGNPGAEHVLATSLDDVVAVPMSRAMKQAGRSGVAAGHGADPSSIERLREGPPEQTRFLGSVAYFPELYGLYVVAALIDVLEGRPVPQEIHMDHVWINRDNVEAFYDLGGRPIHDLGP